MKFKISLFAFFCSSRSSGSLSFVCVSDGPGKSNLRKAVHSDVEALMRAGQSREALLAQL
jgi:hypothetical protein